MHRNLPTACLFAAFFISAASAQVGTGVQSPSQDGWISLGAHTPDFGWQTLGEANWTQDENKVVCDGKPGWLMTTTQWADFELVADYRCLDPDANSGIFIRSALEPTDPTKDCYEINIAPLANPYPTGSVVGRVKAEYHMAQERELKDDPTDSHRLVIKAQGSRIQVVLDDDLVADFDDESPLAKGHIGLQSNRGRVEFKNVRLRPLGTEAIFNGQDLAGWKTDLAGPAKISVTDAGEMQILGGSGQVESEGKYDDFVLQLECKVNGDGLNSGLFFRCIPGEKMNGYECQISNAYKDGDRSQPADCGTGGIYRRVNARRVVASDHEWFGVTVHADGPHIATWVNGEQVVDWTDTREPDENPRKGLRLAPGTFCLQAHDPTTDLLFRNLRVAKLSSEEEN
jgi:hypothetical protein